MHGAYGAFLKWLNAEVQGGEVMGRQRGRWGLERYQRYQKDLPARALSCLA